MQTHQPPFHLLHHLPQPSGDCREEGEKDKVKHHSLSHDIKSAAAGSTRHHPRCDANLWSGDSVGHTKATRVSDTRREGARSPWSTNEGPTLARREGCATGGGRIVLSTAKPRKRPPTGRDGNTTASSDLTLQACLRPRTAAQGAGPIHRSEDRVSSPCMVRSCTYRRAHTGIWDRHVCGENRHEYSAPKDTAVPTRTARMFEGDGVLDQDLRPRHGRAARL